MTSILFGVGRAEERPSDKGSLLLFLAMLSLSRPKESNGKNKIKLQNYEIIKKNYNLIINISEL
jgi:hypothetical protein